MFFFTVDVENPLTDALLALSAFFTPLFAFQLSLFHTHRSTSNIPSFHAPSCIFFDKMRHPIWSAKNRFLVSEGHSPLLSSSRNQTLCKQSLDFFQQDLIFFLRDVAKFSQGLDFFIKKTPFFLSKKEICDKE